MKIAIVDDSPNDRQVLREALERFSGENGIPMELEAFASGEELLQQDARKFDILFLDIDMPGINGMDTARRIRETNSDILMLFATNYAQYAINGYEVEAVDFLIKPLHYYDFSLKFSKVCRKLQKKILPDLALETPEGLTKLPLGEVTYIEVRKHFLCYNTREQTVVSRGNMNEQAEKLRPYGFYRVHRSFLVNLKYVEKVRPNEVTVAGIAVPVGRQYGGDLVKEYLNYIGG